MYSMTGYGASRLEETNLSIFSEIRGLNGRYLQVKWDTSTSLNTFERHLEGILRKQVKRGQLKVNLQIQQYSSTVSEYFNTTL
ncbi:MAG: YicC/YloC family endoribonuclease, partial [Planctomycetota bacterium]